MLDPKFVFNQSEKVKEAVKNRGLDLKLVDQFLKTYQLTRENQKKEEELRARRNKLLKEAKKQDLDKRKDSAEARKLKEIREKIKAQKQKTEAVRVQLKEALYKLPNLPAQDVPRGKDDSENRELKKWGAIPSFDFKPLDHLELGERLGILDVRSAAKVSGPRFGYFVKEGALLELALMWHVFSKLVQKGFWAMIPPVIVKKEIERGLGYAEHGGWDQVFLFEKDNLVFTASSEHAVIPFDSGRVFEEKDLPKRFVNFSSCFRREAGAYGKDVRGMFRVHQFNKVEMNVYTLPKKEISDKECLNLLSLQEEIMQELKLPYRVTVACSGDLPLPNRRMYDLNAWFPGQGCYRETHSCSSCTDFQTRRLQIKVKIKEGSQFVHALNATAITDRVVLAILENYQQKDGSILVPQALQKLVGKEKITGEC